MAHKLSIVGGRAEMFSGRGIRPWHGLGSIVEGLLTSADALKEARLNWKVKKQDAYWLQDGDIQLVPGVFVNVRQDTQKILGRVGARYEPFQNDEAFSFFDALVGEGRAVYDTAGALFDGAKVWIAAKLNDEDFRKSSDVRERYVLLTNSFDGSQSVRMRTVLVRVVCQNTLTMAIRSRTSEFSIPHYGDMKGKIDAAREALGILTVDMRELEKCLEEIRRIKMNVVQFGAFAEEVTDNGNDKDTLRVLFTDGVGCEGKTRYDALNAVTQLTTHHLATRGKDETKQAERRMDSSLSGRGAKMQRRALALLLP